MSIHGRHRSLDKAAKKSVKWLESCKSVNKIILGISECCRHKYAPGVIRFKMDVDGGIKVNLYSGNGVTDVFVQINPIQDREVIKGLILQKYL